MSLTKYCSYDEVRSTLGVNDIELSDAVLSLPVYEMGLLRELNKVSPSLAAAFSAIYDKVPAQRTAAELAMFSATRLFCVYAAARQMGVALPNFAPKDVGDGKATISRFAGEPFKLVLDGVDKYYQTMRSGLQDALTSAGLNPAGTTSLVPLPTFRASARRYDSVTGS